MFVVCIVQKHSLYSIVYKTSIKTKFFQNKLESHQRFNTNLFENMLNNFPKNLRKNIKI